MIRIVGWSKFQHYKRRTPPWIRLYRDLLNKPAWYALSHGAARLLVELWLIASESEQDRDGEIGMPPSEIAWRLRRPAAQVPGLLQELARQGFIAVHDDDASTVLSPCEQVATPETETETETDTTAVRVAKRPREYSESFEQAWGQYPKRAGDNPKAKAWRAWQARVREGATTDDLTAGVQRYAAHCRAAGKLGTEFVMQAATFFGPDERWKAEYQPNPTLPSSKDQQRALAEQEAVRAFAERHRGMVPLITERRRHVPPTPPASEPERSGPQRLAIDAEGFRA